jgi:LPXTG-site transpeptidase (sortase) family protein
MKSAIALISAGLLVLVVALGSWARTSARPVETGQAKAFERALIGDPAPRPTATAPSSPELAPAPGETPSLPRFTVGQQSSASGRVPTSLRIPAIGQEADIIPAGVESNGQMEVPDTVRDVAWYEYGPAPGEPGSAVLAAHVDLAGQGPGVFFELRELDPGNVIYVGFDDGSTEAYRVEARTIYEKQDLPTEAIFSRQGSPVLTLITCGGEFNRSIRRYDSNVVVYAVPTDIPPPDTI